MIAGYEPARVATLTLKSRWAIGALADISSTDGAATFAIGSLGFLRSVIESTLLPAMLDIERTDPLVRAARRRAAMSHYDRWFDERFPTRPATKFSDLSDLELFFSLQFELTRQAENNGLPDAGDPTWAELLPDYVTEFEHRAHTDPEFSQWLTDEAPFNALLGTIVAIGDFSGEVVAAVFAALVTAEPLGVIRDSYRDHAVHALLEAIVNDPPGALNALAIDGMPEALLNWNRGTGPLHDLPDSLIGEVLMIALVHPFDDPTTLSLGHSLIEQLANLAHGRDFDRGFPPEIALAITTGLVAYLPFLVASLELDGVVYIKDFDGDRAPRPVGTPSEIVDLFGSLMRSDEARALLLAAVVALTAEPPNELYVLDDVNDYVHLLIEAADTEQIEEAIKAQRDRGEWNTAIDLVTWLLQTGLDVGGDPVEPISAVVDWIESGARWLVGLIGAQRLGLDDVPIAAHLLLTLGLSAKFLNDRRDADDDGPLLDAAGAKVRDIKRALDNGAPPEEVGAKVADLRDLVERIDPNALPGLDDPRITPPVYSAEADTGLSIERAQDGNDAD